MDAVTELGEEVVFLLVNMRENLQAQSAHQLVKASLAGLALPQLRQEVLHAAMTCACLGCQFFPLVQVLAHHRAQVLFLEGRMPRQVLDERVDQASAIGTANRCVVELDEEPVDQAVVHGQFIDDIDIALHSAASTTEPGRLAGPPAPGFPSLPSVQRLVPSSVDRHAGRVLFAWMTVPLRRSLRAFSAERRYLDRRSTAGSGPAATAAGPYSVASWERALPNENLLWWFLVTATTDPPEPGVAAVGGPGRDAPVGRL
nr:hypothetical protein [Streptomyces sp. BHT-5-2]